MEKKKMERKEYSKKNTTHVAHHLQTIQEHLMDFMKKNSWKGQRRNETKS